MSRTLVISKIEACGRTFYFNEKLKVVSDTTATYNIVFYTPELRVVNNVDFEKFRELTYYSLDPNDRVYKDLLADGVMTGLEQPAALDDFTTKLAWEVTSKLGLDINKTEQVMDFVKVSNGVSPLDALTSVAKLGTQGGMFENLPVIGPIIGVGTDDIRQKMRMDNNMIKWDFVRKAKKTTPLFNLEDKTFVAFIYSDYDLLMEKGFTLKKDENIDLFSYLPDDEKLNQHLDYLNVGIQHGTDVYIFNSVKIDK
ncbi:hypothetical protein [Sinomicrobium sp.]